MTAANEKQKTQIIEKQIDIASSAESVWEALTNAEELKRWFPLEARVDPGKGGKIRLSWGPEWEGTARIDLWEPNRRLRSIGSGSGQPVSVEWTIETHGGKTILRLTQSSFSSGADWENEFYDSTNYGWLFMLTNLRHYLERHAGQPRAVAWARRKIELSRDSVCERLVGPGGVFVEGAAGDLLAGKRYSLRVATDEVWSGRVEFIVRNRGFCLTVDSLNDALAWLTVEGSGPLHDAQFWFSTYGLPQPQVTALQSRWADELTRILPEVTTTKEM
jgi:uncharacterized protein YndB with AHSA1/START domain